MEIMINIYHFFKFNNPVFKLSYIHYRAWSHHWSHHGQIQYQEK